MPREDTTTANIRISIDSWRRLTALKRGPGDDFESVVRRLLDADEQRESAQGSRKAAS